MREPPPGATDARSYSPPRVCNQRPALPSATLRGIIPSRFSRRCKRRCGCRTHAHGSSPQPAETSPEHTGHRSRPCEHQFQQEMVSRHRIKGSRRQRGSFAYMVAHLCVSGVRLRAHHTDALRELGVKVIVAKDADVQFKARAP